MKQLKIAQSVLQLNPVVQEAVKVLENYFDKQGFQDREISPRWKSREDQVNLSPIPQFKEKEGVSKQEMLVAANVLKDEIIKTIQESSDSGEFGGRGKTYSNKFEKITDPMKLLEEYYTFVERHDPKRQEEHKQNLKRSEDREWLAANTIGSAPRNVERWLEAFDQLDTDLARYLIKYIKQGRDSDKIYKLINQLLVQQKDRASQKTAAFRFVAKLKSKGHTKLAQMLEEVMPGQEYTLGEPEPYRVWDTSDRVVEPTDIKDDQELDQFLDMVYEELHTMNPAYAATLSTTVFGTPTHELPIEKDVEIKKASAREWFKDVMSRGAH